MAEHFQKYKISSPGKVILHGEHSVVYGKPALAAVVGLRTFLNFEENATHCISFNFSSLNSNVSINIEEFNDFLKGCSEPEVKLLEHSQKFVTSKLKDENNTKPLVSAVFLLAGAFLESESRVISTGFNVTILTELKIGSGLGSSASYGVCLATAFLLLSGQISASEPLSAEHLEKINMWAYNSERVMHGNPSGVDNTVCTYGGIVRFVKGQGFQTVTCGSPTHILLVDTKVSRSTAKLVQKVAATREQYPKLMESVLQAMEEVVNEAIPIYECKDNNKIRDLEQLFQINNDLLKTIGVSHEKLEMVFQIASQNGYASKLTGAGGGGYAVVLLPEHYQNHNNYQNLLKDLGVAGFDLAPTTVGGDGVRIEIIN